MVAQDNETNWKLNIATNISGVKTAKPRRSWNRIRRACFVACWQWRDKFKVTKANSFAAVHQPCNLFLVLRFFPAAFGNCRLVAYVNPGHEDFPLFAHLWKIIEWIRVEVSGILPDYIFLQRTELEERRTAGAEDQSSILTFECRSKWPLLVR